MSTENMKCTKPGVLRVWHAQYRQYGSYGFYQDYDAVVVAETKEAALGWVAQEYKDNPAQYWEVTEIHTHQAGVHPISSASS